ncbi:MAG: alkaline phosphatase [Bacteroidota bacterium]
MEKSKGYFLKLLIGSVLLFGTIACDGTKGVVETSKVSEPSSGYPKNIIFMIGDGMGLTQVTAAIYSTKKKLNIESFPVIGFHKSHSYDNLKTDSAAGATAFACGVKTFNGAVGMTSDTVACKTILEEAETNGLATGMVVTAPITHATPAAFIAHQPLRVLFENIAADFMETEIDFFVGGGQRYFDYREFDDRDLVEELRKNNYVVGSHFNSELSSYKMNPDKNFAFFTANADPLPVTQGRTYLPYASKMAMNFLNLHSDKGFFLMVEGSQIDWAGHANEGKLLVSEMLDFDKAIGHALDFARADGETLVIVTADHETGGLAINEKSKMRRLKLAFTTNDHTSTLIPVFAYGPQAELFSGIYDNTEIYYKMMNAFQFVEALRAKGEASR